MDQFYDLGKMKATSKICLNVLKSFLFILFWPFVMHWKMFLSEVNYQTSSGENRVRAKRMAEQKRIMGARSRLIEVTSESSFQPLLQFYLFLPTLIVFLINLNNESFNTDKRTEEFVNDIGKLQFWSILTSFLSLSWSFTSYQCLKKNGALNFGTNPSGRVSLLISNGLQILCRLVAFVSLAYCFGDGNFLPAFILVLIHVLAMAGVNYITEQNIELNSMKTIPKIYHYLLNGISNIFLHTQILTMPDGEQRKQRKEKEHSLLRQMVVDIIIMAENVLITICAVFLTDIPLPFLLFVPLGHLFGLILKGSYYKWFHIWSEILEFRNPCSGRTELHEP